MHSLFDRFFNHKLGQKQNKQNVCQDDVINLNYLIIQTEKLGSFLSTKRILFNNHVKIIAKKSITKELCFVKLCIN